MEAVERELLEIRTRLDRLEQRVRQLAGEEVEISPPTPGIPPDPQRLLAWLRAQGLIREPTPEERRLAEEWDALPEEEKEAHIRLMHSLVLDPPLSQIIIDNRR
ncbi:MAG: hypothetical protein J7575_01130 [Chloroflexi bacterium]|jgi:hypothetical protein|nr:hypothetical protein [Chloroflexota bacterium]